MGLFQDILFAAPEAFLLAQYAFILRLWAFRVAADLGFRFIIVAVDTAAASARLRAQYAFILSL